MADAVILTLGCRVNHADSALLTGRLTRAGYRVLESIPDDGAVDLIVINSCAVTAEAVAKSRHLVRKCRREARLARIVVVGCAAALDAENLRAAGAEVPGGNEYKKDAPDFRKKSDFAAIFREDALSEFPFRTRAFIKIQEGCNNFCSYCIVPYVRGREKSRDFGEVIADCRRAVEKGFPEIVLTGVNITSYNSDGHDLASLLKEVASLDGDFRVRIGSAEPCREKSELLEVMAENPKICRFLHLSLQHGCDRILRLMNRHYLRDEYREFALRARKLIPDLHLGTDVIVGFPGETDEDFADSIEFIRDMDFANIHRFIYSPRPGTPAAGFPDQVKSEVSASRSEVLRQVAEASAAKFRRAQTGLLLPVIFEQENKGVVYGWSDNYVKISAPAGSVPTKKIVDFKVTKENLANLENGVDRE